jgi:hypothetical protein
MPVKSSADCSMLAPSKGATLKLWVSCTCEDAVVVHAHDGRRDLQDRVRGGVKPPVSMSTMTGRKPRKRWLMGTRAARRRPASAGLTGAQGDEAAGAQGQRLWHLPGDAAQGDRVRVAAAAVESPGRDSEAKSSRRSRAPISSKTSA